MNNPLVSVCIPCYNDEQYLGETLQAALAQTYENIEIIVCDDCSKDRTVEVAKSFADPRIAVYRNEQNLGNGGNYNRALSYAKGKYAKLLCADDLIVPDCIAEQVRAMEENADKNIVMVSCNKDIIDKNSATVFSVKFPFHGFMEGMRAIKKSVRRGTSIFGEPGAVLMSLAAFRKTNGNEEDRSLTYSSEVFLWFEMMLQGNLYVVNKTLFKFRIVPNTITTNAGWTQIRVFFKVLNRLYANRAYGLTKTDIVIGKAVGLLKGAGRILATKYIVKKSKRKFLPDWEKI